MSTNNLNFFRTAAASPVVHLCRPDENALSMADIAREADGSGVSLLLFPKLSVTGASLGDLALQSALLRGAEKAVAGLAAATAGLATTLVGGAPVEIYGNVYDCSLVLHK
ncbi:MAG: NAD(+) synthase, partial [Bacteroidales bacterium]|nr:NAD(+) synthase [Bacteroidales bacterium]